MYIFGMYSGTISETRITKKKSLTYKDVLKLRPLSGKGFFDVKGWWKPQKKKKP